MLKKKGDISKQVNVADDKKISIALMASFVVLALQYFILIYFNLIETTKASCIQLTSKFLVGAIFLYVLPVVWKRSKIKFMGSFFVGTFLFLFQYLFFPENAIYIRGLIFPFFFICLPAFVYSISLNDLNVLKKMMKKASYIIFIIGIALGVLVLSGKVYVGSYSMSLSYYMLLPIIMFLDEFLDKLTLRMLLLIVFSLMIVLALGARGPVLCTIVFTILRLARLGTKLNYPRIFTYSGVLCAGFFGFVYYDRIFETIYNLLLNLGIKSRSISLFVRDNIHLSGRERLYKIMLENIFDKPVLGIGLAGDRLVLGGGYAHNLFLELTANFGILIGGVIIFIMLSVIFKLLTVKNKEVYNIIIIWISIGFVHLMVSGSYLIDMKFWIFLGLCINIMLRKSGKIMWKQKLNCN